MLAVGNLQKQSPEVFYKKGYSKFRPEVCNFIKKETLANVFPVNFTTFLRTPHRMKCVQIRSFFWYSVRMRENTDQKKLRVTFHAVPILQNICERLLLNLILFLVSSTPTRTFRNICFIYQVFSL